MRRRPTRLILGAVCAALLTGPLGLPAAAEEGSGGQPEAPAGDSLTLITGDRFQVMPSPGGRPQATPEAGTPLLSTSSDEAGNIYQVPATAEDLVATGRLDRELFNTPNLIAAHAGTDGEHIPVTVTYTDGATPASVPGVTMTDEDSGYVTAASAADFGAALQ